MRRNIGDIGIFYVLQVNKGSMMDMSSPNPIVLDDYVNDQELLFDSLILIA